MRISRREVESEMTFAEEKALRKKLGLIVNPIAGLVL